MAATLTPNVDSSLAELAAVMEAAQQLMQQNVGAGAIVTALAVAVTSQAQGAVAARSSTLQDLVALSAASSASEHTSFSNVQAAYNLISSAGTLYSFGSVSVSNHQTC